MDISNLQVIKASGEKAKFSIDRVAESLRRSGANDALVKSTLEKLKTELYDGISTKEIYNRAFSLLRKGNNTSASKYKLKTAIYELGPTGFPFEKFIAALLNHSGYKTETGKIYQGKCVTHEIDVEAKTDEKLILIECKFHNAGRNSDVKTPLYIDSRFRDIKNFRNNNNKLDFEEAWVVTNTRFTADAIKYGKCSDLKLMSWDYPIGEGLKDKIDRLGLYPVTVSTLLSEREKNFLLSRDVVLCQDLINDNFYLDHLGINNPRKKRILKEMDELCKH
ncbi:ATP cone domain-containing protein [Salegentibacter holothuriorum]|uniref:ATP cone domain-containing protein n=1 Tax=Salegentibacter holothuriorum TaxID=241145 RepID=A0A1T5AMT5_9FLAO|nr:restriction endonuclease [Salegentibacter holothuriorum]SKB36276.1 ATP cone domain-containing protein [Salegentibacter holothuriorum]